MFIKRKGILSVILVFLFCVTVYLFNTAFSEAAAADNSAAGNSSDNTLADNVNDLLNQLIKNAASAFTQNSNQISDDKKNTSDNDNKENKKSADKASDNSKGTASKEIRKLLKNLESTTTIPTVCVYTDGGAEVISREDYVNCDVYTINCDQEYKLSAERAGIRVRGNSTAYGGNVAMIRANQVPYKIKFESKTNMFGLNNDAKCKKWVLVKAEASLLKNDIAFRLGRTIISDYNYCSDGILVHMYLNGKFKGIYELCEQSQVNKNRINITETPKGYTGVDTGYLVEIDNYGEKPCFRVNYENAKVKDILGREKTFKGAYYSIKSDVYSEEQKAFIKNYICNVFKIVYEACEHQKYYVFDENFNLVKAKKKDLKQKDENGELLDPAQVVINKALNLESVAELYLVYEIAKDRDVGEGSFFMYTDHSKGSSDNRLTFTCPWDFEWAYDGSSSEIYAAAFNTDEFARVYEERSNPWFIILMKQDWFVKIVSDRWREVRTVPAGKKNDPITACMKQEKKLLETYKTDLSKNSSNEVKRAQSLIDWVNNRIAFLDGWLLDDK